MVFKLFLTGFLHHKNKHALELYKNIEIITDINRINECDVIYSPTDIFTLPIANKKIIYGPHFSVYPDEKINFIKNQNYVYIQPSQWVIDDLWNHFDISQGLNIKAVPFGVDTEMFKPDNNMTNKDKIFIYYKNRDPNELELLKKFLQEKNYNYTIFTYGGYYEHQYIEYLKESKFGIFLDAHESQGFALEEALSMNVPLLVWQVKYLYQEYRSNYGNYKATSIPYWNEDCGEFFYDNNELEQTFNKFINNLQNYKPREFILNNLSMEICEKKFIDLFAENLNI